MHFFLSASESCTNQTASWLSHDAGRRQQEVRWVQTALCSLRGDLRQQSQIVQKVPANWAPGAGGLGERVPIASFHESPVTSQQGARSFQGIEGKAVGGEDGTGTTEPQILPNLGNNPT